MGNFKWQVGDCGCGCKRNCATFCVVTYNGVLEDLTVAKDVYFKLNKGNLFVNYISVLPPSGLQEGYEYVCRWIDEDFPAETETTNILPVRPFSYNDISYVSKSRSYSISANGEIRHGYTIIFDPTNGVVNEGLYNAFNSEPIDTRCAITGCGGDAYYEADIYPFLQQDYFEYDSGFGNIKNPYRGMTLTQGFSSIESRGTESTVLTGSNGYICLFLRVKLRFRFNADFRLRRYASRAYYDQSCDPNMYRKHAVLLSYSQPGPEYASSIKSGFYYSVYGKGNSTSITSFLLTYLGNGRVNIYYNNDVKSSFYTLQWPGTCVGCVTYPVPYLQEYEASHNITGFSLEGRYDKSTKSGSVEYEGKEITYNGQGIYFFDANLAYLGKFGEKGETIDAAPSLGNNAFFPNISGVDGNRLILEREYIDVEYVVAHIGVPHRNNWQYRVTDEAAYDYLSNLDFDDYFSSLKEFYGEPPAGVIRFLTYPEIRVTRQFIQYALLRGLSPETGEGIYEVFDYCAGFGDA